MLIYRSVPVPPHAPYPAIRILLFCLLLLYVSVTKLFRIALRCSLVDFLRIDKKLCIKKKKFTQNFNNTAAHAAFLLSFFIQTATHNRKSVYDTRNGFRRKCLVHCIRNIILYTSIKIIKNEKSNFAEVTGSL